MDIKTAIETAKKIKRCWFTGGYYCSLNGCDNCGNYFDAKEELEMLEAFIEMGERQEKNKETISCCKDCVYRSGVRCTKRDMYITNAIYCKDRRTE